MQTTNFRHEPSHSDIALQPSAGRNRIAALVGMSISLVVLVVVAFEYRKLDLSLLRQMLPTSIAFWLVFAVNYLSGPIADWIVFRRLLQIPLTGLAALIRKLVTNEVVFGYLGEAQFYAWARTHTTAAPFAAIKDVALISALVGNVATLLLLACTWPALAVVRAGLEARSAFLSLGIVLVSSLAMVLFRQKLFTLPRADLWFVTTIQALRTVASLVLSALLWHLVLPQVAIDMWLVMSAVRMLVSRLPFVPNTDILFVGVAALLLGHEPQVGALMAMIAALTLATHVLVGAGFAVADLMTQRPRMRERSRRRVESA